MMKRTNLNRCAAWGLLALSLLVGLAQPRAAHADATTYSSGKRTLKVGILLLDSTIDANNDGWQSPAELLKGQENPDPYVFYIADARSDVKPQNWEFVNPLAPSTVTVDIYNRWSIAGARDPANPYKVGQKVTKNMAAYWEVPLSKANESDLLQFDLLFITHHRTLKITPSEREKLRKVVDGGGVVWIEDCGNMRVDPTGPFFLEELEFSGNAAGTLTMGPGGTSGPVLYQPNHPILNTPYRLTFQEIANIGDKNYGNYALRTQGGILDSNDIDQAPNPGVLNTVVGNNYTKDAVTGRALPYIAAGYYGSGAIIATAGDSGCDINDYAGGANVGSGGNSGAFCGPNINTAHSEDLKLVYNMVSWGSANNTFRRNNRRTGFSLATVNAPLLPSFEFTSAPASEDARVNSLSAPLIHQGILYVTGLNSAGQATVRAYDLQPFRDYDGDGNPDDGRPDLINGLPYDEIWRWDGPAAPGGVYPSAPTLAVVTAGGVQVPQLLVTLGDGTVALFPIYTLAGGQLQATNPPNGAVAPVGATGTYLSSPNGVAPAPTFFENKIYHVEPSGLVTCIDAATLTVLWQSNNMATPPDIKPTGTPAVGAVRLTVKGTISENSGGTTNDIMMYVPSEETVSGNLTAKILPYWLGTRNEVLKDLQLDGTIRTRVASGDPDRYFVATGVGQPFIVPRVRVFATELTDLDGPAGPAPAEIVSREENYAAGRTSPNFTAVWQNSPVNATYFSGVVQINKGGVAANPNNDKLLVSVDYDVVYVPATGAGPTRLSQINGARESGPLTLTRYAPGQGKLDTVAMSPNDLLVYAAGEADTTTMQAFATVFGLNEQEFVGSGSRMRWRFPLHNGTTGGTVSVGGTDIIEAPALRNRLVWNLLNSLDDATVFPNAPYYEGLTNTQIVGAPIVTNDGMTYVLARAYSRFNDPASGLGGTAPGGIVSVLMAFKTNPEITLTLPEAYEPGTVEVSQADMLSYDAGTGNVSTVSGRVDANNTTQFVGDPSRGRITIVGFQPSSGSGTPFSASNSFVVRYTPAGGTAPKTVVLPPSPTIVDNSDLTDATVDPTGDNSARQGSGGFTPLLWHYVLPGNPVSSPTLVGDQVYFTLNYGGGVRVVAVDANPASDDPTVRPGSGEQVYNVVSRLIVTTGTVTSQKTVQTNHVRWVTPTTDAITPVAATAPPVGTEGTVAINTGGGTFAYQESLTLVSDSKRLIEAAADGSVTWSVDATLNERVIGGAGPISDPTGGVLNPADTGQSSLERKNFARPQAARKLSNSDYLVADSGNNRVVRIDRGGKLLWSLDRLSDPLGILAPGDSTTLSNPTDVFYYQIVVPGAAPTDPATRIEDHYIIADSGNNRIVEVVNYRNGLGQIGTVPNFVAGAGTKLAQNVVVWTTRTTSKEGRNLRYQSVRGFTESNGAPSLVAVVSNSNASGTNATAATDSTGGALVQLSYNPYGTSFFVGGTSTFLWPLATLGTNTPRSLEPAANGLITTVINEILIKDGAGNVTVRRITRPTFFERQVLNVGGTPRPVYLICDGDTVYAATVDVLMPSGKSVFVAAWKFDQKDYNTLNVTRMSFVDNAGATFTPDAGKLPRFAPTSVKRLPSGNYLITNAATGPSSFFRNGQFLGEVVEVRPATFVFDPTAATVVGGTFGGFSVPQLTSFIVAGTGQTTNEQRMGRRSNANLTEQPLSADRL